MISVPAGPVCVPGGSVRKFKVSKERKGNLVDPASSHMLVSKTNLFSRGQMSKKRKPSILA